MWFNKIVDNIAHVPDAMEYYEAQLLEAKDEVKLSGNIEKASSGLPGTIEFRYNQLQELEAILEHINIALRKERALKLRHFMEHYNREMSAREAEKWIDGDADIVSLQELINEVAFIRNKYLGIMKGLDIKQWQLTNIVKLRIAGLEDAEVGKF